MDESPGLIIRKSDLRRRIANWIIAIIVLNLILACVWWALVTKAPAGKDPCAANLKQIGLALLNYANENNGALPTSKDALNIAQDHFVCPTGNGSYLLLFDGVRFSDFAVDTIIACDPITNHHSGINVLFGDGHIEWIRDTKQITNQISQGIRPVIYKP
jgi:prepilin-type processing-associated H-X9-DG protein